MDLGKIHILDVIRVIIVLDLPASPVNGLDAEQLIFLDSGHGRDICLQRAT